jgi:hypothetical protein
VNKAAQGVAANQTQQPQNQKQYKNCPKHVQSLLLVITLLRKRVVLKSPAMPRIPLNALLIEAALQRSHRQLEDAPSEANPESGGQNA